MNGIDLPRSQPLHPVRGEDDSLVRPLGDVSVIIPVGPSDISWRHLVGDLAVVSEQAEVLLVGADSEPADFADHIACCGLRCPVEWITTAAGRARQMNAGAAHATRPFLWFLHADSRITTDALCALGRSLDAHPKAIHYFDLTYQRDGPSLTRWNAVGVRIRSRYLGLPFGDQGLCLGRELFHELGGFDETVAYGEDHLLVWAARRHRVPLRAVGASLATSARKYRSDGWLSVTALHAWRTWRQAAAEFCKLLWERWR